MSDTKKLEMIAEDLISHKLQRHDILVAKPKFDRSGGDLLAMLSVEDGARFCRIQCKGRSLYTPRSKNKVVIRNEYVTDSFITFLYIDDVSLTSELTVNKVRSLPSFFKLEQVYPNPFNPATNIEYTLEKDSDISLTIFDTLGNRIRELDRGYKASGTHIIQWDGKTGSGNYASSGEYLVLFEMDGQFIAKKAILVK